LAALFLYRKRRFQNYIWKKIISLQTLFVFLDCALCVPEIKKSMNIINIGSLEVMV
jgi:hypothetical protein